ncbi:MAG TPA: universal stress protein, partial [Polyangiaceae bacterium]
RCVHEPLKLVHVSPRSDALGPAAGLGRQAPIVELLTHQAAKLRAEFAVDVEALSLEGDVPEQLATLAQRLQARLLVVSSLGWQKDALWLLGSVAERVVQRSKTPVLVVRDATGIEAWSLGKRPLRIVLGVDLGSSSRTALRWVEELRCIRPCDVQVVQLAWPVGEHQRFGVKGPVDLDQLNPELSALLERDLRAWVGAVGGTGELSFAVTPSWGRFDAPLAELAQQAHADVLVVGSHQRAWSGRVVRGSVSRGAVHYSSSNIACVPLGAGSSAVTEIRPIRSVLIPTDFGDLAARAIELGYRLVHGGGEVHLLHVRTDSLTAYDPSERLRALAPAEADVLGIRTHVHVVHAEHAWTGISQTAARLGVDAVCMATHTRTAAGQWLLGSQTREVMRRVRQPVMLVRDLDD